jgi:hypothetical protein
VYVVITNPTIPPTTTACVMYTSPSVPQPPCTTKNTACLTLTECASILAQTLHAVQRVRPFYCSGRKKDQTSLQAHPTPPIQIHTSQRHARYPSPPSNGAHMSPKGVSLHHLQGVFLCDVHMNTHTHDGGHTPMRTGLSGHPGISEEKLRSQLRLYDMRRGIAPITPPAGGPCCCCCCW